MPSFRPGAMRGQLRSLLWCARRDFHCAEGGNPEREPHWLRAHMRLLAALGTELRKHLVKLALVPGVHVQFFGRQLQDCHDVVAG